MVASERQVETYFSQWQDSFDAILMECSSKTYTAILFYSFNIDVIWKLYEAPMAQPAARKILKCENQHWTEVVLGL